ncbi:hypothetical protein FGIG_02904 [Fasciola gigantica]|uniref:C-type lectin domain-containing protein n=1 Tax=Fasciola gigantica TaxID=46835 RepID=A0A504ZCT8_FASGI|nr:hypothetical protein FGIG_02904 [Fasciola gigantica]
MQVKEGGRAIINQYTLYATDPDTEEKDILIQIIHAPRWGHIGLAEDLTSPSTSVMAEVPVTPAAQVGHTESGEMVTENQKQPVVELKHTLSFTMEAVKQGLVYYINSRHADGQESLEDVFSVRAYDGSLQSPHTVEVKVAIQPTNDEIPQVRLLKHISVTAGSRRILTPFLFSVSDRDVPRDRLQIQFTQLPIYGNLTVYWQHGEQYTITKDSPPITESYLGMMNVIYVQNKSLLEIPSEENLKPGSLLTVDQFTVSVNDGEHVVERQSQILIRPPNQKPPELLVDPDANDGIVLDGRSWTRLDHRPGGLVIHDNDTADDDLVLTLVEIPKYGIIQRLPRLDGSGGVDLLDLVEDAWDLEESRAAEDVQALNRLAVAGSTGGPKAVKSLKQGDRFTKRQIETGRIHYVYTGTYTSRYVYDSCVLRLTDGAYETAAISLRFRIRNAKGGVGVQTLRYSPADHLQQQLRALQYPDVDTTEMLKSPSSAARSLIMVNHPKSTADDLNYKQQMDQSAFADTIQVTFEYPSVEAHLNEFIFLNMDHLNPESIHKTTSGQFRAPQAFIFYLVGEFRSSGVGVSSLVGTLNPLPCSISLVDAHKPNENMTEIAYRDISMRRIALSARDCQSKLDQTVRLLFRCEKITSDPQIQTESSTYVTVPVKITKKRRALPHLEQAGPVQVLSGADWLVGSDQLLCSDRDTKPTHLIYIVVSSLSSDSSRQLGSLVVANNESSRIFTQHQVNTGQVVFVASNGVNMVNTDVQVIELQLFDAGEFDRVFDPQELTRTAEQALVVLKTHGTTEFNPYLERLQYTWSDAAPTVTIKPIRLEIRPNPLLFSQDIQMDPLRMLVQKSPKPNALETLLPGRTGFRLTAANLYVFHAGTIYTLTDIQGAACELFDLSETRPIRQFAQQALNRRLVAVLIKDASKQVQNETPTSVQLKFELSNPGISPVKRTHSLTLEWTTIGFVRRVYRVCAERGLLSLAVRRDGPSAALKASSVDAYVGLTSETAIEGRDFSLHSQKLLTFQMGETRQTILIRLHPAEQTAQRKLVFHVDLKSPTGTVLDSNRRATVVIRPGPKCKHRSYFSPQQHENPVKRDLAIMDETVSEQGLSATHDVKSHDFADPIMLSSAIRSGELTRLGKPISLAEWLATNQLPDSQTLSASYEQYLINQQTNKCVKGWHYFENRCYRFYSGSAPTTWNKARLQCERQDAFLTSITSDRHAVWVKDTFGIHEPFWIGFPGMTYQHTVSLLLTTTNAVDITMTIKVLRPYHELHTVYFVGHKDIKTSLHQPYPGSIWIWHNLERVGYTNWESGFPVDAKWNREMGRGSDVHTAHPSKKRPKRPTVTPRMLDLESVFRIQNDLHTQPRATPYGHVFRVPRRVPIGKDSPDNGGTGKGPRACVLANTSLFWQNRPCHRFLRSGYVCMRNPEV